MVLLLNDLFRFKTDLVLDSKTHNVSHKILSQLAEKRLITNGGFSISITGLVPIYGYAVSIYKDRECKYKTLDRHDIAEYLMTNTGLLKLPNHFLSGWKFRNHIYLDVSIVLQSLEKAKLLAKRHGQIAIYSLYENIELIGNTFFNKSKK